MTTQFTDRSSKRRANQFEVTGRTRPGSRGIDPIPGRSDPPLTPEKLTLLIPAMGVANRAPGVPIMGERSWDGSPDAMGGPDRWRGASIMGVGDQGTQTALFGASDPRFVDSLFQRNTQ